MQQEILRLVLNNWVLAVGIRAMQSYKILCEFLKHFPKTSKERNQTKVHLAFFYFLMKWNCTCMFPNIGEHYRFKNFAKKFAGGNTKVALFNFIMLLGISFKTRCSNGTAQHY